MKSKTSFFNKGICLDLLRRCWPLWVCWTGLLLLMGPVALSGNKAWAALGRLNYSVLNSAHSCMFASAFAGILAAMCIFGFLYASRTCDMMSSLPVRRETLFCTVYLTGLVPMLAADVLTAGLVALCVCPGGYADPVYAAQWLGITVLGNIAFFGFAVFCAVLTGSIIVLPALYLVLNFAVYAAELCVTELLGSIVYGFEGGQTFLDCLSPVMGLSRYFSILSDSTHADGSFHPAHAEGWWVLILYAAAGLVLSAAALAIFRRRRMETAGDAVSVRALRPVFKYCASVGGALVFAAIVNEEIFRGTLSGVGQTAMIVLLLAVGAFLGWFAAEMVMQKTLRVFSRGWRGLIVVWCVLAALACAWEADVFGYERRIPEPEEVELVLVRMNGYTADVRSTDAELIAECVRLHRNAVENKSRNDGAYVGMRLLIHYVMKDGGTLTRVYRVPWDGNEIDDPGSTVSACESFYNLPQNVLERTLFRMPVDADTVNRADVYWTVGDNGQGITLTREQSAELYNDCILPDVLDGCLGQISLASGERYFRDFTNVTVNIGCEIVYNAGSVGTAVHEDYQYITLDVTKNALRTLEWLRSNTEVVIGDAELRVKA